MRGAYQAIDVPLREPFRIATGEVTTAHNVLFTVDQEGIGGVGESTPFEVITGGTQDRVLADLSKLPAKFSLSAKGFVLDALRALGADRLSSDARHAVDIALHDWLAQARGVPLAKLLGGAPRPLPTSITIPIVPLDDVPRHVREGLDAGFRIFKIKSKGGVETEKRRIGLVRDAAGAGAELRVDANAGWTLAEAREMLATLRRHDVVFLEQPLKRDDLAGHAELVKLGTVPIMVDESLFTLADAERVLKAKAADLFNVKLAKSGGIVEAGRILRFAHERGIDCMVGCMIQTRVATSADAHVAAGFPAVKYADLDGHTFLKEDPVEGGVQIRGGKLVFAEANGHGARLAAPRLSVQGAPFP